MGKKFSASGYTGLMLALIWGLWWTVFMLMSGTPKNGLGGIIMNMPNAIPGFIFLISIFVAWKFPLSGGIILVIEGLSVLIIYPIIAHKFSISTIIFVMLTLGLPPIIGGSLIITDIYIKRGRSA